MVLTRSTLFFLPSILCVVEVKLKEEHFKVRPEKNGGWPNYPIFDGMAAALAEEGGKSHGYEMGYTVVPYSALIPP